MKRFCLLLLLLLLLMPCRAGASLPPEVADALPPEAAEVIEELGEESSDFSRGLRIIGEKLQALLPDYLRRGLRSAGVLLGICAVCTTAEGIFTGVSANRDYVDMAGVLCLTVVSAEKLESMIGLGARTVEELHVFSRALLPTLAAAVAAGGGLLSAGVHETATILFSDVLIWLINSYLLPLTYYFIALSAAGAMLPRQHLGELAGGVKKAVTWLLTGFLLLFTGYLTLCGAGAASADSLTLRLTRSAISAAVPVVGGIVSDAADSVLHSAGLLKGALGAAGMLAVLGCCLTPFLTMAVQYLLYKAAAFLCGLLGGERLREYMSRLGDAFGLVLGMTGSCALLLLISIASCVSVVTA